MSMGERYLFYSTSYVIYLLLQLSNMLHFSCAVSQTTETLVECQTHSLVCNLNQCKTYLSTVRLCVPSRQQNDRTEPVAATTQHTAHNDVNMILGYFNS